MDDDVAGRGRRAGAPTLFRPSLSVPALSDAAEADRGAGAASFAADAPGAGGEDVFASGRATTGCDASGAGDGAPATSAGFADAGAADPLASDAVDGVRAAEASVVSGDGTVAVAAGVRDAAPAGVSGPRAPECVGAIITIGADVVGGTFPGVQCSYA
jgi:hypothetical protein